MAGFDKFILGEKLKKLGWIEQDRLRFKPPSDFGKRIMAQDYDVYDAEHLAMFFMTEDEIERWNE